MTEEQQAGTMKGREVNILFADDDDDDIEITLMAFKEAKLKNHVFVVHDGQEVVDYLWRQGKFQNPAEFPLPDIMLLDINMPKLSGLEVLKKIKDHPQYRMIPVIMLTSSKNETDILKSYQLCVAGYIQKPVNYSEFVDIVNKFNFYWNIITLPKN